MSTKSEALSWTSINVTNLFPTDAHTKVQKMVLCVCLVCKDVVFYGRRLNMKHGDTIVKKHSSKKASETYKRKRNHGDYLVKEAARKKKREDSKKGLKNKPITVDEEVI